MVSAGTHLVKDQESQSRTIEKKIFWPFGPEFGLRIRGGGAPPPAHPLDPPVLIISGFNSMMMI